MKFCRRKSEGGERFYLELTVLYYIFFINRGDVLMLQAFDLIFATSELVERLAANTRLFRTRMTEAGFNVLVGTNQFGFCFFISFFCFGFHLSLYFTSAFNFNFFNFSFTFSLILGSVSISVSVFVLL